MKCPHCGEPIVDIRVDIEGKKTSAIANLVGINVIIFTCSKCKSILSITPQ